MIVSSLALFVALGGTSYAAIVLPRNSVGSAQIKPNAVGGSEIASDAVTSGKVKGGSLLKKDFKLGQLPAGAAGARGAAGADGAAGAAGPQGAKGADGTGGTNGDDGDMGPRGPSNAYYTGRFDSSDVIGGDGELPTIETVIHTLALPQGDYTIAVNALVDGTNPGQAIDATCSLYEGLDETGTLLATTGFTAAPAGNEAHGPLTIDSVVTMTAPDGGSVNLSCRGFGDETLTQGRIIATKVATLTLVP